MNSVALGSYKTACAVFVCFLLSFSSVAGEHGNKEEAGRIVVNEESTTTAATITRPVVSNASNPFSWSADRKLSWNDFKGPVDHNDEMTAAATYCGLGFESSASHKPGQISVKVYNKFFPSRSWVKPGELKSSILAHEQCHFDICELYTRILKKRLDIALTHKNVQPADLADIYNAVQAEYSAFQELYEQETLHGTIEGAQRLWEYKIAEELNKTELAKL